MTTTIANKTSTSTGPQPPSEFRAEPELRPTETNIILTWKPSITTAAQLGGYFIYRKESSKASEFARAASLGPKASSYRDKDLVPGKRYFYMIAAFNKADPPAESTRIGPVEAHVLIPPERVEVYAPSFGRAQAKTETSQMTRSVNLSWRRVEDPDALLGGFHVYRRDAGSPADFTLIGTVDPSVSNYRDVAVKEGTTYEYALTVFDQGTPSRESHKTSAVKIYVPHFVPPPQNVTATSEVKDSKITVTLTWQPSNLPSDIVEYVIYRKDMTRDGDYARVGSTTAVSFVDTPTGWRFGYLVEAKDHLNHDRGSLSDPVEVEGYPLLAPAKVEASPRYTPDTGKVTLFFDRPQGIPQMLLGGYNVYRKDISHDAEYVLLATIPQDFSKALVLKYDDMGVQHSQTYSYQVMTLTNGSTPRESAPSPQATVHILGDTDLETVVKKTFLTYEEAQRALNPDLLKTVALTPWLEEETRGIHLKLDSLRSGGASYNVTSFTVIRFEDYEVFGKEMIINAAFNLAAARYSYPNRTLEHYTHEEHYSGRLVFFNKDGEWLLAMIHRTG